MDDDILGLYSKAEEPLKFKVVGLIPSCHFQKCRYLVNKLHVSFPKKYAKPEVRAMLNLDWDEYLTKMKRRHGKPYYLLQTPVAVFFNGTLLGDDRALVAYITNNYVLDTNIDFEELAEKELIKHFLHIGNQYKRKFVYLTIAIDEHVVGSMLFMLYNDLVPLTCNNFMSRCTNKIPGLSYKGTKVHRIAKYSWVQCGGFDLEHVHMPCENYTIPHDRRGVLSMCNKSRHQENSTQFYITLERASWMDYNYVAFGQLIQGAEILNLIERVSTYYENPVRKIEIVQTGEFTLCPVSEEDYTHALNPPYEALFGQAPKIDDVDSILSLTGYKAGKYCLKTDLRSYLPFTRYSRMFDLYIRGLESVFQQVEDGDDYIRTERALKEMQAPVEEKGSNHEVKGNLFLDPLFDRSRQFYIQHGVQVKSVIKA